MLETPEIILLENQQVLFESDLRNDIMNSRDGGESHSLKMFLRFLHIWPMLISWCYLKGTDKWLMMVIIFQF